MKKEQIKELLGKGYLYCMECTAFTPHVSSADPEWSWTKGRKSCEICGKEVYPDSYSTCKCGYDYEHDLENMDYDHTFHGEGCHFGINKDYESLEEYDRDIGLLDYNPLAYHVYYSFMRGLSTKDRVRLRKQLDEADKLKCGCRTVRIYQNTPILSYRSWAIHSMDCMNAYEWEYELKCPVCRRKHYIQDGNC